MESKEFIRKIADALLDCIREHPDGDVWNKWRIEVDGRPFTAYIIYDADYIEETGETFRGGTERWLRPVPKRVKGLEVYETDALCNELDEELWDVPGNSERIMKIINGRLRPDSY